MRGNLFYNINWGKKKPSEMLPSSTKVGTSEGNNIIPLTPAGVNEVYSQLNFTLKKHTENSIISFYEI